MDIQHGIVLGSPRSGTTYLMRLLNTLPHSECLIGTLVSPSIPQIYRQELSSDVRKALVVSFERSIDAYLHSGRFNSRASAVQKWANTPHGIKGLIDALKGRRHIERMIYKEPFLSFAPDFVDDALPDAQVIHIYRDGRDVANSLVRTYDVLTDESLTHLRASEMRLGRKYDHRYVPWWVEDGCEDAFMACSPYARAIWMWKYMVRICHSYYSRPEIENSGRILLLRYEDLMRESQKYGRIILKHLGAQKVPAFERMLMKAHAKSIGRYKKRNADEVAEAERIAGEELALYGYA